ncbi:CobW family GTP-binding protein [Bifidobacterium sp.]|uniref:CobW family GTP-binding protein n=1 Tax=Bifidobacterium sp. TaxID=41200 RepID=UPI0025B93267|nr:CobW family GTP-binding protein [Bifidobacterium sp.]MCH4209837.1 GTP-binding protein [Bifidobacterium sp.]MCI1224158.1 GTP-binding protein [Bifidobacterium sp.]
MARYTAWNVPVITLTGYLGAGKTTLLNHLLRREGARIGVVINDFGAINVDAALVSGQVDKTASIFGGCLCCMPDGGGLDDALTTLARPKLRLDAIIIEASGLADPIALSRIIHFSKAPHIRPGGIVEVIDALEHFHTVDMQRDPPARYAATNLIVIAKTDMLDAPSRTEIIERIEARVRMRNPDAQFALADHGIIDPGLIFDVASNEDPQDELPIAQLLRGSQPHAHHHAHSASVELPGPVSPSALVELLENPPTDAYRMKGRITVREPRRAKTHELAGYIVNLVGRSIHIAPMASPAIPGEFVAIGMRLDSAQAQRRLDALPEDPGDGLDAMGLRHLHRYLRLSR